MAVRRIEGALTAILQSQETLQALGTAQLQEPNFAQVWRPVATIEGVTQGGVSTPSPPYFAITEAVTLPCVPGPGRSRPAACAPPVRDEPLLAIPYQCCQLTPLVATTIQTTDISRCTSLHLNLLSNMYPNNYSVVVG